MITEWTTEFTTTSGARYCYDEAAGILCRLSEMPITHVGSSNGWDGGPTRACTVAPLELGAPAHFVLQGDLPLHTTPVTLILGRGIS